MSRTSNRNLFSALLITCIVAVATCAYAFQNEGGTGASTPRPTVVLHITCGPDEIFRIMSALRVAEDAINSNRRVVLFFDANGVTVPLKKLTHDLRLGDERTVLRMLDDLSKAGAEIVVPREAARLLGLGEADFVPPTLMGDWGGQIFSRVNSNTIVLSY